MVLPSSSAKGEVIFGGGGASGILFVCLQNTQEAM